MLPSEEPPHANLAEAGSRADRLPPSVWQSYHRPKNVGRCLGTALRSPVSSCGIAPWGPDIEHGVIATVAPPAVITMSRGVQHDAQLFAYRAP